MIQNEEINAIDSEGGVIATLIHHPDFILYDEELQPKHFTSIENRCVYVALQEMFSKGITNVDTYNIIEALNSSEEGKQFVGYMSIDSINELINWSGNIARHTPAEYKLLTKIIRDAAFRRDTHQKLKECEAYCFDKNVDDIEHKIYDTLDSVMLEYNANTELQEFKDIADELMEDVKSVKRGNKNLIEFPFENLSRYVVMEPGECVCFAAPAKVGKSSLLLTTLVHLLRQGKSVLYVDSEISTRLFFMRLLAHESGVPFGYIRAGSYDDESEMKMNEALERIKQWKFIHTYIPVLDDNELWMIAKKAKYLIDMDVIILDYLKANSNDDNSYSVYASLGRVSDTLKNRIAGEMKICAVTAAQMNERNGQIADSEKISRNVSTVVTITEKSMDEIDPEDRYATRKARVTYNRNGGQMAENEWIDMNFDGSLCKFWESPNQHVNVVPY